MMWLLVPLSVLSAILGRLGGAGKSGQWYDPILDTNWRDIGCSTIFVMSAIWFFPFRPDLWYLYLLAFILTFLSFRTYWDRLFGYDCMWFSGLVVGVAGLPLIPIVPWWIIVPRIALLALVWGVLNRYLPARFLWWRRDVAEELLRYAVSL